MTQDAKPRKRRLRKVVAVSAIALASFGLGVAATAIVAVPVTAIGLSIGLVGVGAFGAAQMMTALQSGSSEQRLTALGQLRTALGTSGVSPADAEFADTMRPAVKACVTDPNRDVVALANEVLGMLDAGAAP